jgi:hypothetical protein
LIDKAERSRNLGHFPMSENPELFLTYLHPVLEQIAALKRTA